MANSNSDISLQSADSDKTMYPGAAGMALDDSRSVSEMYVVRPPPMNDSATRMLEQFDAYLLGKRTAAPDGFPDSDDDGRTMIDRPRRRQVLGRRPARKRTPARTFKKRTWTTGRRYWPRNFWYKRNWNWPRKYGNRESEVWYTVKRKRGQTWRRPTVKKAKRVRFMDSEVESEASAYVLKRVKNTDKKKPKKAAPKRKRKNAKPWAKGNPKAKQNKEDTSDSDNEGDSYGASKTKRRKCK